MNADADNQQPTPDADVRALDRLVGTWKVSGEAEGTISFGWLPGGFFLKQDVDLEQFGMHVMGSEIIGREKPFGAEQPSTEITSRFYSNTGDTLDYVYELDGDTLTIWGGEKGSAAYFKGEFSADGNTLTGGWVWPGGGYTSTATRVE
ncbi:hypothetical protein [Phytoactinopolyspora mesophila]|uniref:DUF1579 domain-containing protein n=1 Tax=Phytoactinopolyspora mesophila TaxID=2650750 RepID=A0A7K3LZC5_9ACTN|nr:hypothetical protein [Phytoactinopolyspora mesophila]